MKQVFVLFLIISLAGNEISAQDFPFSLPQLPPGKEVTICYKVEIDVGASVTEVCDQVQVTGDMINLLSDDPDDASSSADPTCTMVVPCQITAMCKTAVLSLDENGEATLLPEDVDDLSTATCGIQSLEVTPNQFTCEDIGDHLVVLTVTDLNGNSSSCSVMITVVDDLPPVVVANDSIRLWPANHKYQTVNLADCNISLSDNCSEVSLNQVAILYVTSDEPEDIPGDGNDGNTLDDIVIAPDCKSVQLRSERRGDGNGRVYTIFFEATDDTGNSTTGTCIAYVPLSNKGPVAINDGEAFREDCQGLTRDRADFAPAIAVGNSRAYPNPFTNEAFLQIELEERDLVQVEITDNAGRLVKNYQVELPSGQHTIRVDLEGLDSTVLLYYQVKTSRYSNTIKMVRIQ